MASVYILPIDDQVAGPALEILRRVVQPESRSLPHITVRYSKENAYLPAAELYGDFVADEVSLFEPATFDNQGSQEALIRTVFFRCLSDQLEYLHHKPDFPQSVFHISIYDGAPSIAAARVLKLLHEYPWHLSVPLPKTRLTRGSVKLPLDRRNLSEGASRLLRELGFSPTVLSASWDDRETLVRAVCAYLHRALAPADWAPATALQSHGDDHHLAQAAFWTRFELMDDLTRNRLLTAERHALRSRGSFMTPPEIAYDIVKAASRLTDGGDVRYGDPSAGGGIFLAALLRQVGRQRIREATLVDADRTSAAVTADRWSHLGYSVVADDFVSRMLSVSQADQNAQPKHPWFDDRPDLVITNPPYVRSQSLDDDSVDQWQEAISRQLGLKVDSRTDLYVYFVLAAHKWLADNGVGVWLLPSEFMFTNYGASLRRYLTEKVTLLKVHSYDGPSVFANARITSCAIFYTKRRPTTVSLAEFSIGGSIENPIVSRSVSLKSLQTATKWHMIADEGVPPVRDSGISKLGDWFEVRRGVATGANAQFVVSDELASSFGEKARQWLKPVLPKARQLRGPVVDADPDGVPLLPDVRWLIDSSVDLKTMEDVSPNLADYLRSIEPIVAGRTLVSRRSLFYRQEKNRPPRFFFSYMSRDLRPARRFHLNRSRAIGLNNYVLLHPRPRLLEWMDAKPGRDLEVLTALRSIDGETMARNGRVYVEGLTKVEPSELALIPFDISFLKVQASTY